MNDELDLGAMFGEMFGAAAFQPDIYAALRLTEDEAVTGVTRDVPIQRVVTCAACDGRGGATPKDTLKPCAACDGTGGKTHTQGFFQVKTTCTTCKGAGSTIENPCPSCAGRGQVMQPASALVEVPPHAAHGSTLRFAGQGNPTADGRGTLFVYLIVGDRPDTRGDDLQAAFQRMLIEPNVPRAIVRRPGGNPVITPPLLLGLVITAVVLALSFLR